MSGELVAPGRGVASRRFWLTGFSTENLADGDTVNVAGREVFVAGHKTFKTRGSETRTVKVIAKFDMTDVKKVYKPSAVPELKERNWSDKSSDRVVKARAIGYKSGNVQLKKSNGKVVEVPLAKLSRADLDYVKHEVQPRVALRDLIAKECPAAWDELQDSLAELETAAAKSDESEERAGAKGDVEKRDGEKPDADQHDAENRDTGKDDRGKRGGDQRSKGKDKDKDLDKTAAERPRGE